MDDSRRQLSHRAGAVADQGTRRLRPIIAARVADRDPRRRAVELHEAGSIASSVKGPDPLVPSSSWQSSESEGWPAMRYGELVLRAGTRTADAGLLHNAASQIMPTRLPRAPLSWPCDLRQGLLPEEAWALAGQEPAGHARPGCAFLRRDSGAGRLTTSVSPHWTARTYLFDAFSASATRDSIILSGVLLSSSWK